MNTLWILVVNGFDVLVRQEDSLWLAVEDDLLHPSNLILVVDILLDVSSSCCFILIWRLWFLLEISIVVEESLFPHDLSSVAFGLHELLDEPVDDRVALAVIVPGNIESSQGIGALHDLDGVATLLCKGNLLTQVEVILELNVDIDVATGDTPAHATEDLVEGFNIESSPEVTR